MWGRVSEPSVPSNARVVCSASFTRYNLLVNLDDTIVAIATPAGRGGIGVVRIAGPEARAIAQPMLRVMHDLAPGRAVFGELVEPCGAGAPSTELSAGLARESAGLESEGGHSSSGEMTRIEESA